MTPQAVKPHGLGHRGLKPIAEIAATRPHGDRVRYLAGCRCTDCRIANRLYENGRAQARKAGDWNGIVSADRVLEHLAELSRKGLGRRAVADAAGVRETLIADLTSGRKQRLRARAERAILAVTEAAALDRALIDAGPTWALLDELLADGYTKTELARQLGYANPKLQLDHKKVTARNAHDVSRLHARLQMCDAGPTLALLQDLSEEGFHRDRVKRLLHQLAADQGIDTPDLAPTAKGRIRITTARLVAQLHKQLTE